MTRVVSLRYEEERMTHLNCPLSRIRMSVWPLYIFLYQWLSAGDDFTPHLQGYLPMTGDAFGYD